jgi:hypothetical protein
MNGHAVAFVYTRVSSKSQEGDSNDNYLGPGIQLQNEICLNAYRGLFPRRAVPQVRSDTGSTFNNQDKLIELDALIEDLPENSLIVIHDVSRLGRNVYQTFKKVYEPVEQKKSMIYSVTDDRVFGLDRSVDMEFFRKSVEAEAESVNKSKFARSRNEIIRRNGGYVGGVPFGMKSVKRNGVRKLERDPSVKRIIAAIQAYDDKTSNAQIRRDLAAKRITNHGRIIGVSLIKRYRGKEIVEKFDRLTVQRRNELHDRRIRRLEERIAANPDAQDARRVTLANYRDRRQGTVRPVRRSRSPPSR